MTMIAFSINKEVPLVTGDLLLSSTSNPGKVIIPSFAEDILPYLSSNREYYPFVLRQKLYILTPKICMAFSGLVFPFKKFLEDLTIFCKIHGNVTAEQVKDFIHEYEKNEPMSEYSILLLIFREEGHQLEVSRGFYGDWSRSNSLNFGEIYSSGSGAKKYLEEAITEAFAFSKLQHSSLEFAIQMNGIMICRLLCRERATLHTVEQNWGAGFEMIYYNQGRLHKLDEITYIINQARFEEDGHIEIPIPILILHYKYYGDILIVTAIYTHSGTTKEDGNNYVIESNDISVKPFNVAPVNYPDDYLLDLSEKDLSFQSRLNCMGYILENKSDYYIPASFNVGPELVVNYNAESGLKISLRKEINDTLINESRSNFLKK